MIHRKARSLMSTGEAMARVAATALSQAASQQTRPTGSTVTHNADGTQTITGRVLGTDSTGTSVTTATHVGDITPPGVPTGVTAWSGDGSVHVSWDGTLEGGIPADFDHVTLYAKAGTDAAITLGTLTASGSVTSSAVVTGTTYEVTATAEDDTCAIDGTPAHNVSAPCTAIPVTVTDVADNLSKLIRETDDGVDVGKSADGTTYADGTSVTRQGTDGTFSILKALSGVLTSVANFGEKVVSLCSGRIKVFCDYDAESSFGIFGTTTPDLMGGAYLTRAADALTGVTRSDPTVGTIGVGKDNSGKVTAFMCAQQLDVYGPLGSPTRADMDRFATAIQPTVLYNGGAALDYDTAPGAGTTGTVTLSEDVSHFKELTIFYHYAWWANSSDTITNPSGKTVALHLMFVGYMGNLWLKTRNVSVSGTSITNSTKAANMAFSLTSGAVAAVVSYDTPEIVIDRVEGRR